MSKKLGKTKQIWRETRKFRSEENDNGKWRECPGSVVVTVVEFEVDRVGYYGHDVRHLLIAQWCSNLNHGEFANWETDREDLLEGKTRTQVIREAIQVIDHLVDVLEGSLAMDVGLDDLPAEPLVLADVGAEPA